MGLFSKEKAPPAVTARPGAKPERRSGRRLPLPISVRIKVNDREIETPAFATSTFRGSRWNRRRRSRWGTA